MKEEVELEKLYSQEANAIYCKTDVHVEPSGKRKGKTEIHMHLDGNNWESESKTVSGAKESSIAYAPPGRKKVKQIKPGNSSSSRESER